MHRNNELAGIPEPRAVPIGMLIEWLCESVRLFRNRFLGFTALSLIVIGLLQLDFPPLNHVAFPMVCALGGLLAMSEDLSVRFTQVIRDLRTGTWMNLAILGAALAAVVLVSEALIDADAGVFDSGASSGQWGSLNWIATILWCVFIMWVGSFLWFILPLVVCAQLPLLPSMQQAFRGHRLNNFISFPFLLGWVALIAWVLVPPLAFLLFGPTIAMMYVSYRDIWSRRPLP